MNFIVISVKIKYHFMKSNYTSTDFLKNTIGIMNVIIRSIINIICYMGTVLEMLVVIIN